MSSNYLYSIILEIGATRDATLPVTMGHQAHGLFLDLVRQIDPALSARLHDEPAYRPFTVSPLWDAKEYGSSRIVQTGQVYHLRITLLDGGMLWQCLSSHFLAAGELPLQLGEAAFTLRRILSTPSLDSTGWAGCTDWQTLATTAPYSSITMRFASPTAFSLGDRKFALFPEPILLWDSLMRSWNLYAPEVLKIEKQSMRDVVKAYISISDYSLRTTTLHFPKSPQKGFIGTCTYLIKGADNYRTQLSALAEFARYAGVGYKTTMGMGQARIEECRCST